MSKYLQDLIMNKIYNAKFCVHYSKVHGLKIMWQVIPWYNYHMESQHYDFVGKSINGDFVVEH